ncbi:uncharacterized protein LOC127831782 [Dreissena polymorpha]|uniref:uncharacterized protein LOC127831782 n=1 Tax=Dreissena polymorpha TaxID=45954 RepID=UPI00226556E2|nr:uncharacterized protein LOC127831782 [Dreissena polymorpha]
MDRRKRERERERKRTARRLLQKCQDPDEQEGVQFSFEMPGDQNKAYNDFHGNQQNSPALTPSVFMYHTPKGIVYSTGSLPDKFNFQQVTSQDSAGNHWHDSVPAINSDQLTNQTNEHVQQDESNICTNGYEEKRRRIRRKDTKAYIRYLNDRRDSFRRENPSISNPNYQMHMMSIEWRNMPDEEKKKYRDAAEKDMERFNEEMLEYQKTGDCKEFHGIQRTGEMSSINRGHR